MKASKWLGGPAALALAWLTPQLVVAQDAEPPAGSEAPLSADTTPPATPVDGEVAAASEAVPGPDWASADDDYVVEYPETIMKTGIAVSPDIVDRREEIIAFIESQAGWAVVEEDAAEFQVTPNPEFFQDLLFSRIKRYTFDRANGRYSSPAMDIAEIMNFNVPSAGVIFREGRSGKQIDPPGKPSRPEWASDVPVPTNLGAADSPDLLIRLGQAMAPVARHHGLLGLVNDQGRWFDICVSHVPAEPGSCPMVSVSDPPQLMYFKPIFIRAWSDLEIQDVSEISLIAIGPDRKLTHLYSAPVVVEIVVDQDGNRVESVTWGDNYDAPARLEEFGNYHILAIGSPDPLDPRIWSIEPGDDLPPGMCETIAQLRVCEALRGYYDNSGERPLVTGLKEIRIYSNQIIGIAPVGGRVAARSEGLWQAQLFLPRPGDPFGTSGTRRPGAEQRQNFEKSHKCGGSYIGDGLIVTAAHCVAKRSMGEMQVRLGTLDIASGGSNFPILSMVIHQDYGKARGNADIAVLRIRTDSRLDRLRRKGLVAPIDLAPASTSLPSNTPVLVTGWGYTGATEEGTDPLLDIHNRTQRNARFLTKITLGTLPTSQCARYDQFSMFAAQDIICARSPIPGRDACYTDSGGPMTRKVGNRRQLVGIVSAGIGCAEPGVPSVYTNVAAFRDWIERAKAKAREPGKHRLP
ncbi:serine protease [Parerythrobacter aestuarii]|uniref:serine protease n=1 Tax=Parerythrobacter aestuarii TaxID=3020909 RepID=UPI0024DEACC8|nr:serine protease [Parerythrobacter aestuarii]